MSPEQNSVEINASSVEDAVQKGLEQLGVAADAVEVDVLDAGSRGLFGLGSRPARVRLTVKSGAAIEVPAAKPVLPVEVRVDEPVVPAAAVAEPQRPAPAAAAEAPAAPEVPLTAQEAEMVRVSRQVVADLVDKMKINATVTATLRRALDQEDEDTVIVNVDGDDLSILIGRRTETLNALQYISSLIIGKQLDGWVPLMIDVQGYRARRERQLRVLARRMAEQALHTGRRQVLEPMPANERRVIHLELRDHPKVVTESIGEEPNRKITIVLKK